MVGSDTRLVSACNLQGIPGEWGLVNIEAPDIVDGLCSGVSSKDKEVWLAEDDGMAVSSSWGTADDWDAHPLGSLVSISKVQEIEFIGCQTTAYIIETWVSLRDGDTYLLWLLRRRPFGVSLLGNFRELLLVMGRYLLIRLCTKTSN